MKKHLLAGVVSVFGVMAFAVAPAVATTVTPSGAAGVEFKANLAATTSATFTPENGIFAASITCTVSHATGFTPSNTKPVAGPPFNNSNPSNVVPSKLAGGSVLTNLSSPSFETCSTPGVTTTTVTSNSTNGKWSLNLNVLNSAAAPWTTAAIGVPKAGATITLVAGANTCVLTVNPENAQGVLGYYENGTATTASTAFINNQMFFAPTAATKAVCEAILGAAGLESPAVFRATYKIATAAGEGVKESY
ncbi:MAG TPA: hypothetical protein VII53_09215 [Solirubrobacteraceae bacterium]